MKLLWLLMLVSQFAIAQQDYYVFIQQPTGKPFYVRMGEESYSSSATGHLILSPMKDSVYDMYIGFPQSRVPEQLFRVEVDNNDRGFELKQFDGSWQLLDIQNRQLVRSVGRVVQLAQGVKRTDTYSHLMAGVVDDTAVLYIDSMAYADTSAAALKAAGKRVDSTRVLIDTAVSVPDTAIAQEGSTGAGTPAGQDKRRRKKEKGEVVVKDSTVGKKVVTDVDQTQADSTVRQVAPQNGRDPRDIIRYRTENVQEGRLMIYVDRSGAVADTIRIIVPR